jgi:hypothetical protein
VKLECAYGSSDPDARSITLKSGSTATLKPRGHNGWDIDALGLDERTDHFLIGGEAFPFRIDSRPGNPFALCWVTCHNAAGKDPRPR